MLFQITRKFKVYFLSVSIIFLPVPITADTILFKSDFMELSAGEFSPICVLIVLDAFGSQYLSFVEASNAFQETTGTYVLPDYQLYS